MRQLWYTFIVFATLLTTQIAFSAAALTDASVDSAAKQTDQKAEQSDQEQEGQNDKETAKEIREGAMQLNDSLHSDAQANQDAIVKALQDGKASNSKEMMELRQKQADFAARSNAEMAAMMKKIDEEVKDPEVREELKKELLMRRALMAEKLGLGNEVLNLERRMKGGPNQYVSRERTPDGNLVTRPLTPEAVAGHANAISVDGAEVVDLNSIDTQVAALDAQFGTTPIDRAVSSLQGSLSSTSLQTAIDIAQIPANALPGGELLNYGVDKLQSAMKSGVISELGGKAAKVFNDHVAIPANLHEFASQQKQVTDFSRKFQGVNRRTYNSLEQFKYSPSATLKDQPVYVLYERVTSQSATNTGHTVGVIYNPITNSTKDF